MLPVPKRPVITKTYGKRGPSRAHPKAVPQWILDSPVQSIVRAKSPEVEQVPQSGSESDDGEWINESTAKFHRKNSTKPKALSKCGTHINVKVRAPSTTVQCRKTTTRDSRLTPASTSSTTPRRPLHLYRRRRVILDLSDSEANDENLPPLQGPPPQNEMTHSSLTAGNRISPRPSITNEKSQSANLPEDPRGQKTRSQYLQSTLQPRPSLSVAQPRCPSQLSGPSRSVYSRPARGSLCERSDGTGHHNSPKIVVPSLSLSQSPSRCKPGNLPFRRATQAQKANIGNEGHMRLAPARKELLALAKSNPWDSPGRRSVRGRLSLVTSSARRSRMHSVTSSKIELARKHCAESPLGPLLTNVSPQKLQQSKRAAQICRPPVSSPLARRQIATTPYVSRTPERGFSSLLRTCRQGSIWNFSLAIKSFSAKSKVWPSRHDTPEAGSWTKIGEASFSEVFSWTPTSSKTSSHNRVVMKVIPIRRSPKPSHSGPPACVITSSGTKVRTCESDEFPSETEWSDAEKEVKLTELLGGADSPEGFIDFKGCLIVSGAYPEVLLKEWDKYRRLYPHQAYNPRPSKFDNKQLYCCILLAHAGTDLETAPLSGWQQAASVFSQVIRALSRAEREYQFEHRDLHWGNLLIQSTTNLKPEDSNSKPRQTMFEGVGQLAKLLSHTSFDSSCSNQNDPLAPVASGVVVSIIDYGLSRANLACSPSSGIGQRQRVQVVYTEPASDIFGEFSSDRDYQFTCYNLMNHLRRGKSWSEFNPATNVVWLHYLVRKLVEEKHIPKPPSSFKGLPQLNDRLIRSHDSQAVAERVAREEDKMECLCHHLLIEAEKVLSHLIETAKQPHKPATRGSTRRQTDAAQNDPVVFSFPFNEISASSFLNWWEQRKACVGL